jgi:hypothetical protein
VGWVEDKVADFARVAAEEGEKTRAVLGGIQGGLRPDGALYRRINRNGVHWTGAGRLVGWSVLATGGPVRVICHDGLTADGEAFAVIDLTDGESETVWLGPGGIRFGNGLFLEQTGAGALTVGAIYVGGIG